MSLINYINIPNELCGSFYQTGSSVICNPPVLDTDLDFIIYTKDEIALHEFLIKNDFKQSCEDEEEYDMGTEGFTCYRKDSINLIVTTNFNWYAKWMFATKVAKKLNLLKKEDRITLFKAILYNEI